MAKEYKCPFCQENFQTEFGLKVHIGKVHKKEKDKTKKVVKDFKNKAKDVTGKTHEIIRIYAFNNDEDKMKELWILKLNREELKKNNFKIPLIVRAKNETQSG